MDRVTIRSRFRSENPEMTERVISDAVLNNFMLDGDKDVCAITKCLKSNVPETFDSVEDLQYYDLTALISKFYDIDEYPGGGVWYNDKPLDKATEAEMNYTLTNWKSADPSTPTRYFRRGKFLWFDYASVTSDVEIAVSTVFISDDFDNDGAIPFNGLSYLEPFHPAIIKYLQWKAKQKIGENTEAQKAEIEYYTFIKRMAKEISGSENNEAFFVNRSNYGTGDSTCN